MRIKRSFLIADRCSQGKYEDTVIFSGTYDEFSGWMYVEPESVNEEELKNGNPNWIIPGFYPDTAEYVDCEPESAEYLLESLKMDTDEVSFTNPRVITMDVTITINNVTMENHA